MRISDISIKNPVMAWMIMAFLMVFGAISFSRLGISQFPDVDFPSVNVSIALSGASPEVIETNVVEPVEDVLTTLEGIKGLSSSSRSGVGNISVEFDLDRNIDAALQEVQTKVSQAQRRLPKDADPAIITKSNPDDQPIIWLAVTSDSGDRRELMKYTQEYLKDQFTSVLGVGDIQLGGFTDPILRVQVMPEKLNRYNITVLDVINTIQSEHSELPGGQVENEKNVFNVRVKGEAKTLEEFRSIIISKRAGQTVADPSLRVRLSDVAKIDLALADDKRFSRFNEKLAIGIGIKKQRGTNAVAVARAVKERMELIKKNLQPGYHLNVNFDTTQFIERSISELNKHLLMAVILTAFVCWLFLGSFTATINVLLSIPTSILGTFIALYFLGFTLNTFTLLGLTLAIGIVVDDAIMVLENIFRYNERGKNQIESAIVGAREITFAAVAATTAVVAIFLPVAFMKGIIGKFFLQFGVTISFAVLLSLLEALTITPMRCASFVQHSHRTTKIGKAFDVFFDQLTKKYRQTLQWTVIHKWKVFIGSVGLMVLCFGLVKFIPKEFTPQQESGLLMTRINLPTGTAFAVTNETTKQVEKLLLANPNVQQIFSSVGGFSGTGADTNTAMMFVSLKPKAQRTISQEEFVKQTREQLKSIVKGRVSMQDPTSRGFGGGGRGFPVEFVIKGPEWEELSSQADQMMEDMKNSGFMTDVDSNLLQGLPEIQIVPDRDRSTAAGVSVNSVASTINAMIGGVRAGQYADGGKRYDIRVDLQKTDDQIKDLEKLYISNSKGNLLPLSRIVEFKKTKTLQQINRDSRLRSISIYANVSKGVKTEDAMKFVREKAKNLKPRYFIEEFGSSKSQKESFEGLVAALVMGLLVAYMILAAQFNSFIDPVTILMALPYSIAGAFIGLFVTQQSLNIYSMIGVLLLMGIVKKNSILLVEFANLVRDRKGSDETPENAMVEAGPTRLRPILMTSFATVAGAIPTAIATGEGAELTRSMAITIIFGVLFSTLLTLYVIPALYVMFEKIKTRSKNQQEIKKAFASAGNEGME